MLAGALLDAEAKMGELLKEIKPNIESSGRGTIVKKKSLPEGISKKQSHFFQTLADNKEIIEQVKTIEK